MSEQLYLLDSSVWIRVLRAAAPAELVARVDDLLGREVVATNRVISLEIVSGARTENDFQSYLRRLNALYQLSIDEGTWSRATRLGYDLRRAGLTCWTPDLIISASAIEHNAVLVHADADFDRIAANADLRVESFIGAG